MLATYQVELLLMSELLQEEDRAVITGEVVAEPEVT